MTDKKDVHQTYAKIKLSESAFWESDYRRKIITILQQKGISLSLENLEQIIQATSFKELSKDSRFRQHCQPCYSSGIPCHPEVEDPNCFLCNCPNYQTELFHPGNNGELLLGKCKAESKKGKYNPTPQFPKVSIWDCSGCNAFHSPKAVENYLRQNMQQLQEQMQKLFPVNR